MPHYYASLKQQYKLNFYLTNCKQNIRHSHSWLALQFVVGSLLLLPKKRLFLVVVVVSGQGGKGRGRGRGRRKGDDRRLGINLGVEETEEVHQVKKRATDDVVLKQE